MNNVRLFQNLFYDASYNMRRDTAFTTRSRVRPSEDSDQPALLYSQIKVFPGHSVGGQGSKDLHVDNEDSDQPAWMHMQSARMHMQSCRN